MKAFDSVSWRFLSKLLCKFGFSLWFMSLVMNNIRGAWFSVLINGKQFGFFQSAQGIKQGDPLSPFLFLLVAEALSHKLKGLLSSAKLLPFSLPQGCFPITHLSYAGNVLIFMRGQWTDIKTMLEFLNLYQAAAL